MPRSAYHPQLILLLISLLLLCGLGVHLLGGRSLALQGVTLDEHLRIQPGSNLTRTGSLGPGARVVDVGGRPVATPAEVSAVARPWLGSQAPVRVDMPAESRSWSVTAHTLVEEPLPEWTEDMVVDRIDDVPFGRAMSREELLALASVTAPDPLHVEATLPARSMVGPLGVVRNPPDVRGVAFLVLAALLAWVGLSGGGRPHLDVARDEIATLQVVAGATASGAFATLLVEPASAPMLWLWAGVPMLVQRGAGLAQRLAEYHGVLTRTHYGILLVPSACLGLATVVSVTWGPFARDAIGSLQRGESLVLLATMAGLAMWVAEIWLVRSGRGTGTLSEWALVLLPAVGGALATGLAAGLGLRAPLLLAAAFVFVTADWTGSLASARLMPSARVRNRYRADERDLVALLDEAGSFVPDGHICLAVGLHDHWIGVEAVDLTGNGSLQAQPVSLSPELEATLGMLAAEGGMLPRANDEDDAFSGVCERLGILGAIPCPGGVGAGAEIRTCLVVLDADEGGASADLDKLVALAAEVAESSALGEARGIAAGFLLRRLERTRRPVEEGDRPEASTGTAEAVPGSSGPEPVSSEPESAEPKGDAAETRALRAEVARLEAEVREQGLWQSVVSGALARAYPVDDPTVLPPEDRDWLRPFAASDRLVLLIGEPGSGKEFIARAIHALSDRRDARLGVLDLSTLPTSVVEFELFGDEEETGLCQLLVGGTLLLKSASRMEERGLRRALKRLEGAGVRVIVGERYVGPPVEIPAGVSRCVVELAGERVIHLTPLREKPENVRRATEYYLQRFAMRYDRVVDEVPASLARALASDPLASNYHSLQERVRDALLRSASEDEPMGAASRKPSEGPRVEPSLAERASEATPNEAWSEEEREERGRILNALDATDWVQAEAARSLGMSRGKLLRRLRKFGIERPT